jgi:hypothetical protein
MVRLMMMPRLKGEIEDISTMHHGPVRPGVIVRLVERSVEKARMDEVQTYWLSLLDSAVNLLPQPDPEGCCTEGTWLERLLLDELVHAWDVALPNTLLVVGITVVTFVVQCGCHEALVCELPCPRGFRLRATAGAPFISSITWRMMVAAKSCSVHPDW